MIFGSVADCARKVRFVFLFLVGCFFYFQSVCVFADISACKARGNNLVVLLKLDDVVAAEYSDVGVSEKWSRITNYLEENKISASFGIIGESLEKDNYRYFSWIKERDRRGYIEFWNHGYALKYVVNRSIGAFGEFNGASATDQKRSLARTQFLSKSKTGVELKGFGPHFSSLDENTFDQLDSFDEIVYVWFYKPLDQRIHRTVVLKRLAEIEAPIFKPNFEAFLKTFERADKSAGYLALQGHPNEWDEKGFDSFIRIVKRLKDEGAIFCRPSDFINK